jgi:hypothetical protein
LRLGLSEATTAAVAAALLHSLHCAINRTTEDMKRETLCVVVDDAATLRTNVKGAPVIVDRCPKGEYDISE